MEKTIKPKSVQMLVNEAKQANGEEFLTLVKNAISVLENESKSDNKRELCIIPPRGEAIIVGDLHGDLENLISILEKSKFLEKAERYKNQHLIFLGDYGDRGNYSPEVYFVVLKLKEMYPSKVVLMRGNHEGPGDLLPTPHDLPARLTEKYGEKATGKIYLELRNLFGKLYNATIVSGRYVLIHGGFPGNVKSINDLADASQKHPKQDFLEEMLWNDPEENIKGFEPSHRGAGKVFGENVSKRVLSLLNVKVLIRGHQPAENGYMVNHNGKILTLFSTNKPPYSIGKAAYLQVSLSEKIENAYQLTEKIVSI